MFVLETLIKLKKLFSDESKWIKENFALDQEGNIVESNSDEAVCWCLYGGLQRVSNDNDDIREETYSFLTGIMLNDPILTYFNDKDTTTYPVLMKFIDDAIQEARNG